MSKEAVFTMKLELELRDALMAEAAASHRPASQIVRELMREFVQRQREAREHEAFLRGKVDGGLNTANEIRSEIDITCRFELHHERKFHQGRFDKLTFFDYRIECIVFNLIYH